MSKEKKPTFLVHNSIAANQVFLDIQLQAADEGRGEEVRTVMDQILRCLQRDPGEFGEPLYRLPHMRMQIRTAILRPLLIHFGVCEDVPHVFIKSVKLLV